MPSDDIINMDIFAKPKQKKKGKKKKPKNIDVLLNEQTNKKKSKKKQTDKRFKTYGELTASDSRAKIYRKTSQYNIDWETCISENNVYSGRSDTKDTVPSAELIQILNTNWCGKCDEDGVETSCDGICGKWYHADCVRRGRNGTFCDQCR